MCQSSSHGHHHHGRHHSHPSQSHQKQARAHHHVDDSSRLTRRQALGRLKAAGLVAAASASPWSSVVRAVTDAKQAAPAAGAATRLFDFKQVAPGVFGAIARPTAMLNCNAAVIVNRDHVLVVDTHSKPSAAKALIRQIREDVTELPVRYVVDSHLHGDHAMGNEAYPEVFGASVEVISSVKTREWLEKLGVLRMQETLDSLPKQIAEFRAKQEASRDESVRAELATHIEGLAAYLKGDDAGQGDAADDDVRPSPRHPPRRPGDPPVVPGPGAHRRRRRRLYPLGARGRDRRPHARPSALHGGWLPRRVAGHIAGPGGPGVRPRHPRPRVDPGRQGRAGRSSALRRGDHRQGLAGDREGSDVLDELKKTITVDTLASLKAGDASGRVEREITTLFPAPIGLPGRSRTASGATSGKSSPTSTEPQGPARCRSNEARGAPNSRHGEERGSSDQAEPRCLPLSTQRALAELPLTTGIVRPSD